MRMGARMRDFGKRESLMDRGTTRALPWNTREVGNKISCMGMGLRFGKMVVRMKGIT